MIICTNPQGSDEWLDDRSGVVTMSELGAVMANGRGGAPSLTREEYMVKTATEILTGRAVKETYQSFWMKRGNLLEQEARAFYAFQHDQEVTQVGLILVHSGRAGASVDGLVGDSGLLEIKDPKLTTHVGYLRYGGLAKAYAKQVQGQLWVTEREWCDLVSYHPDSHKPTLTKRIHRDETQIKLIRIAVAAFIMELDDLVAELKAV